MNYEDDFDGPRVPKDTRTLDLFGDAKQPPTPAHLLNRCENACTYVKDRTNLLAKPRCSKCGHTFVR